MTTAIHTHIGIITFDVRKNDANTDKFIRFGAYFTHRPNELIIGL